ncbi:MAG: cellulase family glycosylhydrolase, partial [Clostridia bacterium]|nr:cellulase family glycosylhydrolase [Clostridia bacterium]
MVELDYPTYDKSEGITLWLNRDSTEAGKSALKLDIPVKETNNTLYLPYEAVKAQLPVNNEIEYDPNVIAWGATEYIHIQDIATLMDGKVWWDEAEEMVVFTLGERKSDGILRNINGRFYMNGQPYYEISFNKFDIAAQILINYFPDNFRDFNIGEDQRANAELALKELSDNGFTSIRFFSYVDSYEMIHDPVESEKYWAGLDELYDLCDKYGIKVVPSLSLGSSVMTACEHVEGLGYVSVGEDSIDLITNPDSKSRAFQKAYIESYVNRYKDRDTVLMWEINNEMNLEMDIGGTTGKLTYSAYQLSAFYAWCTSVINECDPDRMVVSGDSVQRNANYHLLAGVMAGREASDWTTDTYGQRL